MNRHFINKELDNLEDLDREISSAKSRMEQIQKKAGELSLSGEEVPRKLLDEYDDLKSYHASMLEAFKEQKNLVIDHIKSAGEV